MKGKNAAAVSSVGGEEEGSEDDSGYSDDAAAITKPGRGQPVLVAGKIETRLRVAENSVCEIAVVHDIPPSPPVSRAKRRQ